MRVFPCNFRSPRFSRTFFKLSRSRNSTLPSPTLSSWTWTKVTWPNLLKKSFKSCHEVFDETFSMKILRKFSFLRRVELFGRSRGGRACSTLIRQPINLKKYSGMPKSERSKSELSQNLNDRSFGYQMFGFRSFRLFERLELVPTLA